MKTTQIDQRDAGLDLLRFSALFLMVGIHFARVLPCFNRTVEIIAFVGEAAPAFFFVAFGMTMDKYLSKSFQQRFTLDYMFLIVCLFHNLYVRQTLFVTEFLFCLWAWRVILDLLDKQLRPPVWVYAIICTAIFAIMLSSSQAILDILYVQAFSGPFCLLPWGLFVIIGLVYSRAGGRPLAGVAAGVAMVLCAWLLTAFPAIPGARSYQFIKWPISAPYILLWSGCSLLLCELGRLAAPLLQGWSLIRRPLEYMSKNLLLGTVLHYVVVFNIGIDLLHVPFVQPLVSDAGDVLLIMGLGSVLLMAILGALVWAVKSAWNLAAPSAPMRWLHGRAEATTALVLLLVMGIWAGSATNAIGGAWPEVFKYACLVMMTYWALNMVDAKQTAVGNMSLGMFGRRRGQGADAEGVEIAV